MNAYADTTTKHQQSTVFSSSENRGSAVEQADHRPEREQMVQLQALMNNSPQVRQLNAYQQLADSKTSANAETQPDRTESDDAETTELEGDNEASMEASTDLETFFTAQCEGISVLNETHHLEYRMIAGEPVLGIASTWGQVSEIHVALRQLGVSATWRYLWRNVDNAHKAVVNALAKVKRTERLHPGLKSRGTRSSVVSDRHKQARKQHLAENIMLGVATTNELSAARAFIAQSATEFSTEVAEILGSNMPTLILNSDVAPADAGNVRYHTGQAHDPIPITWYKPAASYNVVNVHDSATAGNVALQPFGVNPVVQDPLGNNYQFGVTAPNRPGIGTVLRNMPKHGKTRVNQVALNNALGRMGYNMAGEDGDHVLDLGFGGNDAIANYWPLDSVTNRLAFTGWRSTYYLNYKTNRVYPTGEEEVVKAPLNAGNLIGKYVRIVAEEASASPVGNNTSASGSSTAWGIQQTVLDSTGAAVVEG